MPQPLRRIGVSAFVLLVSSLVGSPARAGNADGMLRDAIFHWMDLIQPESASAARTLKVSWQLSKSAGLPGEVNGMTGQLMYQWPDRLRAAVHLGQEDFSAGRDVQTLWAYRPAKKFGVIGQRGLQQFAADPKSIDNTVLAPFELPVGKWKMRGLLLAVNANTVGREQINGSACTIVSVVMEQMVADLLGVDTNLRLRFWLRDGDLAPMRVAAADGKGLDVQVEVLQAEETAPVAADAWPMKPAAGDKVEHVALSHLTHFLAVGPRLMNQQIPQLGPATGQREVFARSGKGRLELIDGTRVLFLSGTPEEMGKQQGELLAPTIRDVMEKILYGVGVGSSFYTGDWFFGQIENAQSRVEKFTDPRVLREMDALADAAGVRREEARLANFFPELFHCSGFALLPGATGDGHVYHGRVLDYLKGVGLEQNAVVTVYHPSDGRNAWVNLTYAGFVGSVTAMNERGISIGEMGGHGAGQWDGKPMAQLVREVMENAATLDEAVQIMRRGPRTCEYYYVLADGKTKTAVGIGATPTTFELVRPGEAHARLPHPVKDAVLLSADERYELLVQRVQAKWGKFDADSARELMTRPVCMTSNIQSVLFVPDTLDFYVANADGSNVASHTRYTKYNLKKLMEGITP